MISEKYHEKVRRQVAVLQRYADRFWYPPFIGLLAALDNFLVIIPNDGILISSTMMTPKRWLLLAICVGIGSTIGGLALASVVEWKGLPWILDFFPGIDQSQVWRWTEQFFNEYGLLVVFVVAITPILQQPAIIIATLAHVPLFKLVAVLFTGRMIKYLIMSWLATHAPKLLGKIWGLSGELKDAGVKLK